MVLAITALAVVGCAGPSTTRVAARGSAVLDTVPPSSTQPAQTTTTADTTSTLPASGVPTTAVVAVDPAPQPCNVLTLAQVEAIVNRRLVADPNNGVIVQGDPETTEAHRRTCTFLGASPDDPTIVSLTIATPGTNTASTDSPSVESYKLTPSAPGARDTTVTNLPGPATAITNTRVGLLIMKYRNLRITASVTTGRHDDLATETALAKLVGDKLP